MAEAEGPAMGLGLADALADELDGFAPLHITRAELLARLGRDREAADAYRAALARTTNTVERRHLDARLAGLGD